MSSTTYGVALLGFGTVGRGVYDLLNSKASPIKQKHGADFQVRHILVRNPENPKYGDVPKELFAEDIGTIVGSGAVDIVIEVMGGIEPARSHILSALKSGKHVITANKSLLAECGCEIARRAKEAGLYLGYSAAITGAHQLADSIANSVMVRSLRGVFNGTSNYILTKMDEDRLDFDAVLRQAQDAGYAEADPSADVDGIDTRNKLAILTNLAFGIFPAPEQIQTSGIRNVHRKDIEFAAGLGYKIKLVGESMLNADDRIEAQVSACLVPADGLFARARGINNAIEVDDMFRGLQGMIAEGAGANPTAMAIYTDLVNLIKGKPLLWPVVKGSERRVAGHHKLPRRYYVRMEVKNCPGTLGEISRTLGRHGINIGSVHQPEASSQTAAQIVLTCGPAARGAIEKALRDVARLDEAIGEPFLLPIIQGLDPTTS